MAWDQFPEPGIVKQFTGTALSGVNCAAATAAMQLRSERQGKRPNRGSPWPPTSDSFRSQTGDRVGGLLATQVDETGNRIYGIDVDFRIASAALVESKLRAGYPVSFLHRFAPIRDAGFRGSGTFGGNHSSFAAGIRGSGSSRAVKDADPMFDGRRSSVPRGPQFVPWDVWVRAGELLVIGDDGQQMWRRYGRGMLYVGLGRTPFRPGAPTTQIRYSVRFGEGTFYVYRVVNGVIVGRDGRRFSGSTSAPCGAPAVFAWPGHSGKRLVRVSAGALEHQYVAVPQGSVTLVEKEVLVAA